MSLTRIQLRGSNETRNCGSYTVPSTRSVLTKRWPFLIMPLGQLRELGLRYDICTWKQQVEVGSELGCIVLAGTTNIQRKNSFCVHDVIILAQSIVTLPVQVFLLYLVDV